jgi:hypothetical protein
MNVLMRRASVTSAVQSENALFSSTGRWAPANLNSSAADPFGVLRQSTSVEVDVWIRIPSSVEPAEAQIPLPLHENVPALTASSLGWDPQLARAVRQSLDSFAEEWDDPAMTAYDEP